MAHKPPITSPLERMLRLGGLAGRVGASMLGARFAGAGRTEAEQQQQRLDNLARNAARIVETLGELKGAAMKVGQMLSLHEGLVPPEVSAILRPLQGQAPRVPFEVMQDEVRRELPNFDDLFRELEPEAFAAASIGQVHRARLNDGRLVAVKIQYPEIEEIVRADLTNLRRLFQALFALVSEADFDPIWQELRERLLEELDYEHEADNARRMARLCAEVPQITIPAVVDEASTRHVLTMEYLPAIPGEEAASDRHPQELRNRWGRALFDFQFRGMFRDLLLHADPNLANFAFRRDGGIVVYDFGCVKRIPAGLARGYAQLVAAAAEGRIGDVPGILEAIDVRDESGGPVGRDLTDPYVELFGAVFRASPPYRFGENEELYERMLELGLDNWSQQLDIRFPRDLIFVQRTLSGHFGNMCKLEACGPWREIALAHANALLARSPSSDTAS